MISRTNQLAAIIGALSLAAALMVVGLIGFVARSVELVVRVDSTRGDDVHIRVPGALAKAGVSMIPARFFSCVEDRHSAWKALVLEACRDMDHQPDFDLLQATTDTEEVRIAKRGGSIELRVDSPSERVRLSVPVGLARYVLERFASDLS